MSRADHGSPPAAATTVGSGGGTGGAGGGYGGIGLPSFFGEVGVDHVPGDRRGARAVLGVLGEDHARDLGILGRREEDEEPVVAQVALGPARALLALIEMTCAVPVFPATSRPSRRARPPVPAALTTIHNPSCTASMVECFIRTTDRGVGAGYGTQPRPSSMARTRCGVCRVPPLATVIIITASDTGVTDTCPWPIETEIVSPAYHFSPVRRFFHAVDGMIPWISCGRSIPLILAEAERRRPLVHPIDPEHVADRVEVDVARFLDRVTQCRSARAGRPRGI